MRFFHIADLHLGKRVNEFSMIDDQRYILDKIIEQVDDKKPDAILIAGDIYDKAVPSAESVVLLDDFLSKLVDRNLIIIMISGNHDSSERLAFAASIMKNQKIYISPVFNNEVKPVVLNDVYGKINVYMLPYIKPIEVRRYYADKLINDYNEAVKTVVNNIQIDKTQRNIILAHQFITGAEETESEQKSVGSVENISVSIFDDFDYVALGHLHRPQSISKNEVRYAGSPLKYSFSEINDKKGIVCFDINEKTKPIEISILSLIPKRDMVEIRGNYLDIVARDYYVNFNLENYYHIILTDEQDIPNALGKLRSIYKNIMKLEYDNARTRAKTEILNDLDIEKKKPIEIVAEFYKKQNNKDLSDEQKDILLDMIDEIWGEKNASY